METLTPEQKALIESLHAKATPEEWAALDAMISGIINNIHRLIHAAKEAKDARTS